MKIMFISNGDGGFANHLDVPEGTTVGQFFRQQMPDRKPEDFLIRVNRQPVAQDTALQEDDRVTVTPTKIEGAAA